MGSTSSDSLKNEDELEFVVFCIENLAIRHEINASDVYSAIKDKSNILDRYIIPGYRFLHTQDKEYILDDIEEIMNNSTLA